MASNFLDPVDSEAIEWVGSDILSPADPQTGSAISRLSLRWIASALRSVWNERLVSFFLGFLFESVLQAQQSFVELSRRPIELAFIDRRCSMISYRKEARDRIPHRALLKKLNDTRRMGIVKIADPARQTTAILKGRWTPASVWRAFVV